MERDPVESELEHDVNDSGSDRLREDDAGDARREPRGGRNTPPANVVLLGGMGAGKSSVGWHLARALGYGFIDLDRAIEAREKKPVAAIFADQGEEHFRQLEREAVARLRGLRSHVVAVGGGTVVDDDNWHLLSQLGISVWLNTPPAEIARRFASDLDQVRKRPLLAELADMKDRDQRHKLLTERLSALIGNRMARFRQATVAVSDAFSTPESTARLVKDVLVREKLLELPPEHRPFDRWGIL